MSRIPRRGVVSPLDSVSGVGARDGTPVHLFLLISFLFVLDVVIRSLLINFTPLFCSALESSILFPVASLTLRHSISCYCGLQASNATQRHLHMLTPLSNLINTCLLGVVPDYLKHASVQPRLKRHTLDPSDLSNFSSFS